MPVPLSGSRTRLAAALPAVLALALLAPGAVRAQEAGRLQPVSEGDGRIHGGPVLPVSQAELHPGQVQTLNLHPRYHAVIEFPFPVLQVDAGDPEIFLASKVGNKLTLKATRLSKSETTMSVMLADADMTVVPFLIRADSTQPFVYIVRYTDPVAQHLNQAESAIASRLQADVDARVEDLAEQRVQQRLLMAGEVVRIGRSGAIGRGSEQITLSVESAQTLPGADGTPRLYLRYYVRNTTVSPLNDLGFSLRVQSTKRRKLVFESTENRELFDVADVRSAAVVPAGGMVTGLLILDQLDLKGPHESLTIEAVGFGGQRRIVLTDVLVGREQR